MLLRFNPKTLTGAGILFAVQQLEAQVKELETQIRWRHDELYKLKTEQERRKRENATG